MIRGTESVMITIEYTRGKVLSATAKGHSDAGPKGQNIVCAMATGLFYTLAQNVTDARLGLKGRPKIQLKEGDIIVRCRPKDKHRERIACAFDAICRGFALMEHNFPENIKYIVSDGD